MHIERRITGQYGTVIAIGCVHHQSATRLNTGIRPGADIKAV